MADAPPPVLTLQVKKGRRGVETRQWRAGSVLRVGRVATGNDLAVRDAGASQRHLSILFLPPPAARWAVSDVGSSNGTLLNGVPLVPTVPTLLSDGDAIKIGESSVLAVSIAPDSDPNPGPRRSSRQSAAVVVEQEKPPPVTRRGGRKNAAAAAEPPDAEKEEPEPEEAPVVTRRGARKKAAELPKEEKQEKGKDKGQEKVDDDEEEEVVVVTRRGGRKKAAEPHKAEEEHEKGKDEEQEEKNEGEEKEVEVAVVTRRGGRRKAAPEAVLPPPPPRARSTRAAARRGKAADTNLDDGESEMAGKGRGRATRSSSRKARSTVPEDSDGGERQEGAVSDAEEQVADQPRAVAATDGEEQYDKVEAMDGEVGQNAKTSEAPVGRGGRARRAPKGKKAKAQRAASANGAEEEDGGKSSSLETMTLREWFGRMNVYLPRMINEAAEEALSALRERHRRIDEYISTLED
ncbi:ABC transporter F family member 4-like [Oryza brachyantha]|uniref:ABC transporter F family member 4-like n=1 Tax=Oryza brachyantha TaxID=4533 RepID=UPI001ADA5552|nr:ABC transporter F family member 4-like [Oryza brachyantha]